MNLTKILAGLLLALALLLAIGAWMLGRPSSAPASTAPAAAPVAPAQQHDVVVAAKAIAAGQRLVAEDLKVVRMPAALPHGFGNPAALLGRTTGTHIHADAPLFEQQLLNGLALQLESGQRAVSVAVKEAMAAGHHVRPGDFVDVFFTLDGKSDQAQVDTQTRLLLARSRVLAYGAASVENPPPTAAQRQEQEQQESGTGVRRASARENAGGRPDYANTAVLAVALDDVQRLTLAERYGQLSLALRHPDDMSVPDPALFAALPTALQPVAGRLAKGQELEASDRAYAGLRFKDLAAGAPAKSPPRPPAALQAAAAPRTPAPPRQQTVEVYQGGTVHTVAY